MSQRLHTSPSHNGVQNDVHSLLKSASDKLGKHPEIGVRQSELKVAREHTLNGEDAILSCFREKDRLGAELQSGIKQDQNRDDDNWQRVLPSGKPTCRVDNTWKTPVGNWAFEVKQSKQDLKKSHVQVLDYMSCGYSPVVVGTRTLFEKTTPENWPNFPKMMVMGSSAVFGVNLDNSKAPADLASLLIHAGIDVTIVHHRDLFGYDYNHSLDEKVRAGNSVAEGDRLPLDMSVLLGKGSCDNQ